MDIPELEDMRRRRPDSIERKMRLEETELALLSPSQEPSVSDYSEPNELAWTLSKITELTDQHRRQEK